MNIQVKITGSGTVEEVIEALRSTIISMEYDLYADAVSENGRIVWEDSVLLTEITEDESASTD